MVKLLEAVTVVGELQQGNDHHQESDPTVTEDITALLLEIIMELLVWMVVNEGVCATNTAVM